MKAANVDGGEEGWRHKEGDARDNSPLLVSHGVSSFEACRVTIYKFVVSARFQESWRFQVRGDRETHQPCI